MEFPKVAFENSTRKITCGSVLHCEVCSQDMLVFKAFSY